jgi:formylglycine-generating enzyme required for sulfatase activity
MAFLMVVFDIWFLIWTSELQMLQARQWLCILLLAVFALPGRPLYAQYEEDLAAETLTAGQHLQINISLAAATEAMQAGKFDEPPGDSALFHYRAVLDIDPLNAEAVLGLRTVQESLISMALDAARDLDFEMARRILDDAARIRESRDLIDAAQQEITDYHTRYARQIEDRAIRAMDNGDYAAAERELINLIALGGAGAMVGVLRQRLEDTRDYGGFRPGQVITDRFIGQDLETPESVIVRAGSFMMGSSPNEENRKDNEGPRHRVTFRRGFAIGRTEVTVAQFRVFVEQTRYRSDAHRQGFSVVYNHSSGRLARRDGVTWKMNYEGNAAADGDPVVHVSWNDATAYVRWLASGTGKPYRLPSESEFEYALRAGRAAVYWWGDGVPPKALENLTGERDVSPRRRQWSTYFEGYEDGYWGPAPVGSFEGNPFGLNDMAGNVGEWVQDCWHDTFMRAPVDGSAWLNPGCRLRTIRGGYWASSPDQARAAYRLSANPDRRDARIGFRIARDL